MIKSRFHWGLIVLGLVLMAWTSALAPPALADGDPGSDVLVYQDLFVGFDSGLSVPQQVALSNELAGAAKSGLPVRVAIIAHPDDLGTVTPLWGEPQKYADYLGTELSLAFKGRLVVVMPSGVGFYWVGHYTTTAPYKPLASLASGPSAADLMRASNAAVQKLARAAGVRIRPAKSARGSGGSGSAASSSGPVNGVGSFTNVQTGSGAGNSRAEGSSGSGSGGGSDNLVGTIVLVFLAAAGLLWFLRRQWTKLRSRGPVGVRAPFWATSAGVLIVAGAATAIAVSGLSSSSADGSALAGNPNLDPGTPLPKPPAPQFTLYDQFGHSVSLSSFRGKVVLLAFTDSECTTLCPLTTAAMLDAKRMLGPAASKVELVGVDSNPKSIAIDDVLSYSQVHGMVDQWKFLTGSLPQLERVWRAYHVEAEVTNGLIAHTAALFVIDPAGRLRRVYVTQQSYAAIGQYGQLLAREASSLLPGHPAVHSRLSYSEIPGIAPAARVTVPREGGGTVSLGPDGKARLYVFFATWAQEVTSLGGHLDDLDAYASAAEHRGLPALTGIDEGSVEPSPSALPSFLRSLAQPLSYPVGIDQLGRLADGYGVEGQPWFVLVDKRGRIRWYWQVSTSGWPSVQALQIDVRDALAKAPVSAAAATARELAGSPAPLAALHTQSGKLVGSEPALLARIRALRGYPIVLNAWASWCTPCQEEFDLFASASAAYGKSVAFLGANTDDTAGDAESFLAQHPVSYPSYEATSSDLSSIIPSGVNYLPTTIFINRQGKVAYVHLGQYVSQGTLDADIETYALRGRS